MDFDIRGFFGLREIFHLLSMDWHLAYWRYVHFYTRFHIHSLLPRKLHLHVWTKSTTHWSNDQRSATAAAVFAEFLSRNDRGAHSRRHALQKFHLFFFVFLASGTSVYRAVA
jgi:hypothetical protein